MKALYSPPTLNLLVILFASFSLDSLRIVLATQEAEIYRITVQSQPRQNSSRDPISKTPNIK
jgi:hypothetical protein